MIKTVKLMKKMTLKMINRWNKISMLRNSLLLLLSVIAVAMKMISTQQLALSVKKVSLMWKRR